MPLEIDNTTYTIKITQGDSVDLVVNSLPTDKTDYTLYFAVRDIVTGKEVGDNVSISTLGAASVTIPIPKTETVKYLTKNNQPANYYWGLALEDSNGIKHTLQLGSTQQGTNYSLIVYPEQIQGV